MRRHSSAVPHCSNMGEIMEPNETELVSSSSTKRCSIQVIYLRLLTLIVGMTFLSAVCESAENQSALAAAGGNQIASTRSDNATCAYKVQVFVAHQDDDLFFMETDLQKHLDRGACIQVVYATDGKPRSDTWAYSARRDQGALAAWSFMQGVNAPDPATWSEDRLPSVNGHLPVRYTSPDGKFTHILLGVDDPWEGDGWGSYTPISHMEADPAYRVEAYPYRVADPVTTQQNLEHYVRAEFVKTLSELIARFQPDIVYTQDYSITTPYLDVCWLCGENNDHPSHIASAKLAMEALANSGVNALAQSYVDYPLSGRPLSLSLTQSTAKSQTAAWYGKYDYVYSCTQGPSGQPVCAWDSGAEGVWVKSQYHIMQPIDGVNSLVSSNTTADFRGGNVVAYVGNLDNKLHIWNATTRVDLPVDGQLAGAPSIVTGSDARLSVFARTAQNDLLYLPSKAAGGWWPPLTWDEQVIVSAPQAKVNNDGRLAVVARAVSGGVLYRAETSVGGGWDGWRETGLSGVGNPSMTADSSQSLAIAVRTATGTIKIRSQIQPGYVTFQDVAFPPNASTIDPILLNASDGSVLVIAKEANSHGDSDIVAYQQLSGSHLSLNTTWSRTVVASDQDWVNITATVAFDGLIVAGNCGNNYGHLCVPSGSGVKDLGQINGSAQFLQNNNGNPTLMVRGPAGGASVLQTTRQAGGWSTFSPL